MELNGFYNYVVHILIMQNIEIGESELKNVGEKSQNKKELILHNNIISVRLNQNNYIIQGSDPFFRVS